MKRKQQTEPADESFEQTFIALMLLLLCFMVIMVSLAQLEGPRFRKAIGSVKGALSMLPETAGSSMFQEAGPGVLPSKGGVGVGDPSMRGRELEELKSDLEEMMGEGLEGMLRVEDTGSRLELTLGSLVLFNLGEEKVRAEADPILGEVGRFLEDWPGQVKVIGHTCNLPIRTSRYPSNWDLSIARAVSVVRFLSRHNIEGARLLAMGMGESRPLAENDTEEHRAMNRRVEILLEYGDEHLTGEPTETAWGVSRLQDAPSQHTADSENSRRVSGRKVGGGKG